MKTFTLTCFKASFHFFLILFENSYWFYFQLLPVLQHDIKDAVKNKTDKQLTL